MTLFFELFDDTLRELSVDILPFLISCCDCNILTSSPIRQTMTNALPKFLLHCPPHRCTLKCTISAIELTKLPPNINTLEVLHKITTLTNFQKIDTIKYFILQGNNNIDNLDDIKDKIVLHHNNIELSPSFPYVYDENTKKNIRIPNNMYNEIITRLQIEVLAHQEVKLL
jgi:hypothetical protein